MSTLAWATLTLAAYSCLAPALHWGNCSRWLCSKAGCGIYHQKNIIFNLDRFPDRSRCSAAQTVVPAQLRDEDCLSWYCRGEKSACETTACGLICVSRCLSSTVRLRWQNTPHTDAAFISTVYFDCGMEKRIIVLSCFFLWFFYVVELCIWHFRTCQFCWTCLMWTDFSYYRYLEDDSTKSRLRFFICFFVLPTWNTSTIEIVASIFDCTVTLPDDDRLATSLIFGGEGNRKS